jgi:hypothetical protein
MTVAPGQTGRSQAAQASSASGSQMPAAVAALTSVLQERDSLVVVPSRDDRDGDGGQNRNQWSRPVPRPRAARPTGPVTTAEPGPVPPSRPRTLSAICPWTAGNSRTHRDTAGCRPAKRNSPRVRKIAGHGLFSLVVAGARFELA